MNMLYARQDVERYIEELNAALGSGVPNEHTYRAALQTLLQNIINDGVRKEKDKMAVADEAQRLDYGAPDYVLTRNGLAVGYIESRRLGEKGFLRKQKKQFERYKKAVSTIVFTDHLRFVLYENDKPTLYASLGEIKGGRVVINEDNENFHNFFKMAGRLGQAQAQPIGSASLLAQAMAAKARLMADILSKAMHVRKDQEDESLFGKMEDLKKYLVHDMTEEQFADFYAQTIVYGIFFARIHDKSHAHFTLKEAGDLIPESSPFLKHLFKHIALAELHKQTHWVVEDLVNTFRVTDIHRLMGDYEKDPLVHFYEDFLQAYNPRLKRQMGVWYTPVEIVRFIVNAVDGILRDKLGIKDGLANNSLSTNHKQEAVHRVQILDPATGTGTFLAEVANKIHEHYQGRESHWNKDVVQHIVPRLNGFEYLMAPYTMAQLKVATALHLDERRAKQPDRLNIFLTNSLDKNSTQQQLAFAKYITDESNAAGRVKDDLPINVVIGNPPYNERSANNNDFISDLMDTYKQEPGQKRIFVRRRHKDGKRIYKNTLDETNIKGLNNDYCKFIRLGQKFLENNEEGGVMAYICANTFLDTRLFRGMRYELLREFDEMYIVNLHGSTKRQETTGDRPDEGVFDIVVGVSINIFIKHKQHRPDQLAHVFYKDLYPMKKAKKLDYLRTHTLDQIDFCEVTPEAPFYTLRPRGTDAKEAYRQGFALRDLFPHGVCQGLKSGFDDLLVANTEEEAKATCQRIATMDFKEVRRIYHITGKPDRLEKKRAKFLSVKQVLAACATGADKYVTPFAYRPFDTRWTLYHKKVLDRHRPEIARNLWRHDNVALCLGQEGSTNGNQEWNLAYVSTLPVDMNMIPRGGVYVFPLYVYDQEETRHTNLSADIVARMERQTGLRLQQSTAEPRQEGAFLPLNLLDYIYAMLHSRLYRTTFHDCLQDDFPLVPYPSSAEQFLAMAALGQRMRRLHLLQLEADEGERPPFLQQGDNVVTARRFEQTGQSEGRVWINGQQCFERVPAVAWSAHVAGYQPLSRWLQDREGRQLSDDEVSHYQLMVVALTRQEALMKEIDACVAAMHIL